jgi:hypothetical protein
MLPVYKGGLCAPFIIALGGKCDLRIFHRLSTAFPPPTTIIAFIVEISMFLATEMGGEATHLVAKTFQSVASICCLFAYYIFYCAFCIFSSFSSNSCGIYTAPLLLPLPLPLAPPSSSISPPTPPLKFGLCSCILNDLFVSAFFLSI